MDTTPSHNKPTLVMIHGLVGSQHYYEPQRRLAGIFVHTPDLLGFGDWESMPPNRLTLADQADHLAGIVDRLSAPELWLLGHSMGGGIAMLLADRRPDRIRGIINVEGNFTIRDAFWASKIVQESPEAWAERFHGMQVDVVRWLESALINPTPERIERARAVLHHQPAETIYRLAEAIMRETAATEHLEAVRRVLARRIELHLIAGARSAPQWDIPDFVREAARSYTVMPGTGHMMMLEEPDEFCRIVREIIPG